MVSARSRSRILCVYVCVSVSYCCYCWWQWCSDMCRRDHVLTRVFVRIVDNAFYGQKTASMSAVRSASVFAGVIWLSGTILFSFMYRLMCYSSIEVQPTAASSNFIANTLPAVGAIGTCLLADPISRPCAFFGLGRDGTSYVLFSVLLFVAIYYCSGNLPLRLFGANTKSVMFYLIKVL